MSNTPSDPVVVRTVLQDAINNAIIFIITTVVIVLVGSWSWTFGIVLAGIETLFLALQSLKVLFIIVADVVLFFAVRYGKYPREKDEKELRWASLIRIVELAIWIGCFLVLYWFFF